MDNSSSRSDLSHAYGFAAAFVVGLGALMLDVAWSNLLPPVFASRRIAGVWVPGVLSLGIAIGSLCEGFWRRQRHSTLRTLALVMIAIALTGALVVPLMSAVPSAYVALARPLARSTLWRSAVGMALTMAVVIVPACLSGWAVSLSRREPGSTREPSATESASHFGFMLLGGAAGVVVSAFVLMPAAGARRTALVAACVVGAVGLTGLRLSRRAPGVEREPCPAAGSQGSDSPTLFLGLHTAYVFLSLVCMLLWARVIGQAAGNTAYTRAMITAVSLAGASVGLLTVSSLGRHLDRPSFWMGTAFAATGLVWSGIAAIADRLPLAFLAVAGRVGGWGGSLLACFILSVPCAFVPAFLAGGCVELTTALVGRQGAATSGSARRVIVATSLAAVAGLLVAQAIPGPLSTGSVLSAASCLWIGCWAATLVATRSRFSLRLLPAVVMAALTIGLVVGSNPWNRGLMTSGAYLLPGRAHKVPDLSERLSGTSVPFYKESAGGTVAVVSVPDGKYLKVNGSPVGSTGEDLVSQILSAHIPALLHGNARRVLLVGIGTGITAGSIETHTVESVRCIEPIAEMLDAARLFGSYNGNSLDDPRFEARVEDPANFLLVDDGRYDLIVCQTRLMPSGHDDALTGEFLELARARLAPGGVICQTADFGDLAVDGVMSVVKTFMSYFPDVTLWLTGPHHVLIVAAAGGTSLGQSDLASRFPQQASDDLRRALFRDEAGVLSTYLAGRQALADAAGHVRPNTRDTGFLSAYVPRSITGFDDAGFLKQLDASADNPLGFLNKRLWEEVRLAMISTRLSRCQVARRRFVRALAAARGPDVGEAVALMEEAASSCPENGVLRAVLSDYSVAYSRSLASGGTLDQAMLAARRAVDVNPASPGALHNLAMLQVPTDPAGAIATLRRAAAANPDYVFAYLTQAEIQLSLGQPEVAVKTLRDALAAEPSNLRARYLRALSLLQRGLTSDARQELAIVLGARPRDADAVSALAYTYLLDGDLDRAEKYYSEALDIDSEHVGALDNLAAVAAEKGQYGKAVSLWTRALQLDPADDAIKANIREARQKMGSK